MPPKKGRQPKRTIEDESSDAESSPAPVIQKTAATSKSSSSSSATDLRSKLENVIAQHKAVEKANEKLVSELRSRIEFLEQSKPASGKSSSSSSSSSAGSSASLAAAEKQASASAAALKEVEAENKRLLARVSELEHAAKAPKAKKARIDSHVGSVEKVVEFFQRLTGMHVEWDDEEGKYRVNISNVVDKRILNFELTGPNPDGDIEYHHVDHTFKVGELPQYMEEDIVFDESQFPGFGLSLFKAVFEKVSGRGAGGSSSSY